MKIYLVGGAIRDKLLDEKPHERDFVVVGATPEAMLKLGFKQVGKGFPVFLHPKTHEEYALARTERKSGRGYTEFAVVSSPTVTLEQDLLRRDLTINAIAEDESGKLIDPFGGVNDLKARVLKHVSAAFAEDPLRVLRVARFAARFTDFTVHPDTINLMQKIVATPGEIDALVKERVWQECERALSEPAPWRFFEVLDACHALNLLFPEVKPVLNTVLTNLKTVSRLSSDAKTRWATLGTKLDEEQAKALAKRLKPPRLFSELLLLVIRQQQNFTNALALSADELLKCFNGCDAFRKPERFFAMLLALEVTSPAIPSPQFTHLRRAYYAASSVDVKKLVAQNLDGEEFKQELIKLRSQAIGCRS